MPAGSGAGTHISGTTCGAQNGLRVYPYQWLKKRVRGARQNMDKAAKKGGEAPQQECPRETKMAWSPVLEETAVQRTAS